MKDIQTKLKEFGFSNYTVSPTSKTVTFTDHQEYLAWRDNFGPTRSPLDPHAGEEVAYSDKKERLIGHGFTRNGWSFFIAPENIKYGGKENGKAQ